MRNLITWSVRKLTETAPKLAFQVTASVAATLCVAFLSNAFVNTTGRERAAAAPDVVIADFGAHLLKASFTEGGIRIRSSLSH
ncbi:MAG TPA: hypothetical protein VHN20_13765 [Beijerinckiaceae bacterium]|nr:hypothetical protein [Beijerinckiaceae bacterium]